MKNSVRRKASTKKTPDTRSAKRTLSKEARSQPTKTSVASECDGRLTFNHAIVYVKDVERGLSFYRALLGFKLVEDFRYENKLVYARLRVPGGDGTIALHQAGPDDSVSSDGVRLYFEVRELDEFCRKLQQKNFYITETTTHDALGLEARLISMIPMAMRLACIGQAKIA